MQLGELVIDDKRAQQFTLFDVFAAITLASILLAMFVPWIRWMKPEHRMRMLFPLGMQLLMLLAATTFTFFRRRALVERSGKRFGVAFFGTANWSGWLPIKSLLLMTSLATIQLLISIGLAYTRDHSIMTLFNSAQISFVLAHFGVNFLWRVYPSTLEFFQHGVVNGGQLFPWSGIEIRESQFFNDRVSITLKSPGSSVATITRMARVSDELRNEIVRLSGAATSVDS